MDEGETARATLTEWAETQSFCFLENASLRVRLDALNSSAQSPVIRAFGQSPEAQSVYDATLATLRLLHDYAWPLRAFFWVWSDLRVVVSGDDVQRLTFAYSRAPGPVCRGLRAIAEGTASLAAYDVPPVAISSAQTALHALALALCENCVNGCPLECEPVRPQEYDASALAPSACRLTLSPAHAPCISVTGPSKQFLDGAPSAVRFSLTFFTYMSSYYAQNLVLGLALFFGARRLARSRTFHYVLGASVGVTCSVLLALYVFTRQTKSATRLVPGFQLLQSLGTMVSIAVPFTGYVLMPSLYALAKWALGYGVRFWLADELLGVPHLGKIYVVSFALLGVLLVWWNQWGASPRALEHMDPALDGDDDDGVVADLLSGADDDLPLTTAQTALARTLQLAGLLLLVHSTSSTESSLLLVALVLLMGLFETLGSVLFYWYHYEAPGRHSTLISKKEFEAQAKTETEKALQALQEYLRQHPDELEKVKEESEIRLRRFAKGRHHLDVAARDPTAARSVGRHGLRSYCVVQ
ncbi:hypothetical protein ATCC90586_004461 [Pythium insidiosum]|nr:hypothetical protein ATCC90586_004461 [Pythium insidiosum]